MKSALFLIALAALAPSTASAQTFGTGTINGNTIIQELGGQQAQEAQTIQSQMQAQPKSSAATIKPPSTSTKVFSIEQYDTTHKPTTKK
jgi:Skp family chaperone for outer membrane proteins